MTERAHELLDVHRDDRLVLDDKNFGGHLLGDLPPCLSDEIGRFRLADTEDLRRLRDRKLLDRHQKERLPGKRRHHFELGIDGMPPVALALRALAIDTYRLPQIGEGMIERYPRVHSLGKH